MNRLIAVVMLAVAVAILLGTLVGLNFPLNRRSASLTNSSGTANNFTTTNPSATTASNVQSKPGTSTTSPTSVPDNIAANTTNATPAATTTATPAANTSSSPTPNSAVDSTTTSNQQPVKALW